MRAGGCDLIFRNERAQGFVGDNIYSSRCCEQGGHNCHQHDSLESPRTIRCHHVANRLHGRCGTVQRISQTAEHKVSKNILKEGNIFVAYPFLF